MKEKPLGMGEWQVVRLEAKSKGRGRTIDDEISVSKASKRARIEIPREACSKTKWGSWFFIDSTLYLLLPEFLLLPASQSLSLPSHLRTQSFIFEWFIKVNPLPRISTINNLPIGQPYCISQILGLKEVDVIVCHHKTSSPKPLTIYLCISCHSSPHSTWGTAVSFKRQ